MMTMANSNQSKPKHRKIIQKLLENLLLAQTEINDLQNSFRGMLTLQGQQPINQLR